MNQADKFTAEEVCVSHSSHERLSQDFKDIFQLTYFLLINLQVDQAFALAPIDPTGNIDYKSLCYIITHGDEKEES